MSDQLKVGKIEFGPERKSAKLSLLDKAVKPSCPECASLRAEIEELKEKYARTKRAYDVLGDDFGCLMAENERLAKRVAELEPAGNVLAMIEKHEMHIAFDHWDGKWEALVGDPNSEEQYQLVHADRIIDAVMGLLNELETAK